MEICGLLEGHILVEGTWTENGDNEERDRGFCLLTREQSPQMPVTNMAQHLPEYSDIRRDRTKQQHLPQLVPCPSNSARMQ